MEAEQSPFFVRKDSSFMENKADACLGTRSRWQLRDGLERVIPFIRDIPSSSFYYVAVINFLLLLGLFSVIFVLGYFEALNTTFLTPSDSKVTGQICDSISTTNTGTFLATDQGYWQNSPSFQFSNATYVAVITGLSMSEDEYANLMNLVYHDLCRIGSMAVTYDLSINLMFWMSVNFYVPALKAQRLYLIGDPTVVFHREHQGGVIAGVNGSCINVQSVTSCDKSTGSLLLQYRHSEYINDAICNATAPAALLGYLPGVDSEVVSVEFDVRTLITAVAVNSGTLSLYDLVEIPIFRATYDYHGRSYTVSQYYYPKFAGMAPLTCSQTNGNSNSFGDSSHKKKRFYNVNNNQFTSPLLEEDDNDSPSFLCVMTVGQVYGIPIFNHVGASFDLPTPCNCSSRETLDLNSSYANCNLFNFLSGFLFWPSAASSPAYALQLAIDYNYDYAAINSAAFKASFINSYFANQSPYRDTFQSQNYRKEVFQFCQVNDTPCSMVIFTSFDSTPSQINWAISDYYFQLNQGACQDSFTPSNIAWQRLVDEPFAPLSESYLECKNSPTVVLLNQVGIAMGNLHLFAPFVALIVAAMYYLSPCCWKYLSRRESDENMMGSKRRTGVMYSRVELDRANEVLAYALLLARDKNLKRDDQDSANKDDSSDDNHHLILQRLTAELIQLHSSAAEEETNSSRNNLSHSGFNTDNSATAGVGEGGRELRSPLLSEDQFRSSSELIDTPLNGDGYA